jgi:hypothetical protein
MVETPLPHDEAFCMTTGQYAGCSQESTRGDPCAPESRSDPSLPPGGLHSAATVPTVTSLPGRQRPRRPSLLIVVLALVVVAVPTVFAVFPEAAIKQQVWWRLLLLGIWASADAVIRYRAASRKTTEHRPRAQ